MDKWLNHPTSIKIMALLIGIIMWAVVHFDPESPPNNVASLMETKRIDGVKVEPFGLDERNFVLQGIEPQTVSLTVRGRKADVISARKEDYSVRADLTNIGTGTKTIPLQVSLPRGMELVGMVPGTATVTIEALQTKEFEVDIRPRGTPAEGYIAGTPIVKPTNRVHVTLPESKLAHVDRVGAEIPVDGQTRTIKNKSVKLAAFDENGRVIEGALIDPAVVEVEVPITNPFKTVPLQFRMLGRMPPGLSIAAFKPEVEQVTIYGPKDALDSIEFIEADVQLDELTKSGKVTLPLTATAPLTQIAPDKVVVDVEVVLSDTRSLEGLPIIYNGLGAGLSVKMIEPATNKADIIVKGSPAMLGRLQPGDVQVIADLSGKGPGTHTVPLIVNLPRFIEQAGGTSMVKVEITAETPASANPDQPPKGADGSGSGSGSGSGQAAGSGT